MGTIVRFTLAEFTLTDFTLAEFKSAIRNCRNHSSPGVDSIPYILIKHLTRCWTKFIIDTYNECLNLGYFPAAWKTTKTVIIPKPGKSKQYIENYRPITLINCLGKVLEKMITNRLTSHLERTGVLPMHQAGFRIGRSTTEHIFNLTEKVSENFAIYQDTAALFLDVEKAFDKASHRFIRYKLLTAGVDKQLCRLIISFLDDRLTKIQVNDKFTEQIPGQSRHPARLVPIPNTLPPSGQ
jgi:hypothetical protein